MTYRSGDYKRNVGGDFVKRPNLGVAHECLTEIAAWRDAIGTETWRQRALSDGSHSGAHRPVASRGGKSRPKTPVSITSKIIKISRDLFNCGTSNCKIASSIFVLYQNNKITSRKICVMSADGPSGHFPNCMSLVRLSWGLVGRAAPANGPHANHNPGW